MNTCLTIVHALSPLRFGTREGVSGIDLTIARERATNLPFLPASSVRGALREECKNHPQHRARCEIIFGPKHPDNSAPHKGFAIFTDQRLLGVPVRSLTGSFAWVSSHSILNRLKREAVMAGITDLPPVPTSSSGGCLVTNSRALVQQQKVILEDENLNARIDDDAVAWAEWLKQKIFPNDTSREMPFAKRLCILPDEEFQYLAETVAEVTAHTRLYERTRTVKEDSLFYEVSLPVGTIFSGFLDATDLRIDQLQDVFTTINDLTQNPIRLGGRRSYGFGLCQLTVI